MQLHHANRRWMVGLVKKARQMVDKQLYTFTWVVFNDVIDLVNDEGSTREDEVLKVLGMTLLG